MTEFKRIRFAQIRIDGGTQNRTQINQATVKDYSEAIMDGAKFPAVKLFFDGVDYWLADGFHRYWAHKEAGCLDIDADISSGTKRDAVLYSVGANASHGLRRTNADKRKAVETLLNDPEWSKWSDREIARRCAVSNNFVSEIRKSSLSSDDSDKENKSSLSSDDSDATKRTYTTKHGTQAVMKTENIGGKSRFDQKDNKDTADQTEVNEMAQELYGEFDPIAELELANKEIDRLSKIIESNDALAAAMAENKRLSSLIDVLEERMRGYQVSENEAKRAAQMWKNKFDRLEKQVKEAGLVDF